MTTLLALSAIPTTAQEAVDCEWWSEARNLVEPWEDNTRTFANGNVRLALLDTVEPAAAAFHILVLSPPFDELGERQCRVISMAEGVGFGGLDFASMTSDYDPARGLVFDFPVRIFYPLDDEFGDATLSVTLNQSTGAIAASVAAQ